MCLITHTNHPLLGVAITQLLALILIDSTLVVFEAQTCWEMISWETRPAGDEDQRIITSFSEPPVLSDLPEETLRQIAKDSRVPDKIYRLPSHNQNVERAIQLVSSVSQRASQKQDRRNYSHCLGF